MAKKMKYGKGGSSKGSTKAHTDKKGRNEVVKASKKSGSK